MKPISHLQVIDYGDEQIAGFMLTAQIEFFVAVIEHGIDSPVSLVTIVT